LKYPEFEGFEYLPTATEQLFYIFIDALIVVQSLAVSPLFQLRKSLPGRAAANPGKDDPFF
jgi:hypothetical protein